MCRATHCASFIHGMSWAYFLLFIRFDVVVAVCQLLLFVSHFFLCSKIDSVHLRSIFNLINDGCAIDWIPFSLFFSLSSFIVLSHHSFFYVLWSLATPMLPSPPPQFHPLVLSCQFTWNYSISLQNQLYQAHDTTKAIKSSGIHTICCMGYHSSTTHTHTERLPNVRHRKRDGSRHCFSYPVRVAVLDDDDDDDMKWTKIKFSWQNW